MRRRAALSVLAGVPLAGGVSAGDLDAHRAAFLPDWLVPGDVDPAMPYVDEGDLPVEAHPAGSASVGSTE